jgi:hypothetical protein
MDQLKDFLRQCVKYRFWIAFGVSLLLPTIGYFVGVGGMIQAKVTREREIDTANKDIGKYTARGIVNAQYQPLAAQKNVVLTQDVDDSWRKLRSIQEPLLKWPEEVEAKFLRWGRKYPTDVDRGEVTRTLVDYTFAYPGFVSKIYKIFKPFNYEDGTGIVVAPDEKVLLRPAAYSSDNPPDLSKVWAEQERIWVVTALLDAVAKINDSVKAKDWEGAIVKQINLLEVGSQADQDQKSMAEGVALVPADFLATDGTVGPAPVAATPASTPGGLPGPGGNSAASADEVYYLKNDAKQFKTLPIKMTVLVEQSKLPDFLVGLENSPITIQVMEAEVAKPAGPVFKPTIGERSPNSGMGGPGGADSAMGMMGSAGGGRTPGRAEGAAMAPGGMRGPGSAAGQMGGPGAGGGASKGGTDVRGLNKAQQRKEEAKASKLKKTEVKARPEPYLNIVEVTVYGQARFYLAPPPAPVVPPSTAVTPPPAAPQPEAPKAETPKPATPVEVKKDEATKDVPKAEEPAKKAEEPAKKAEEPAKKDEAPKAETTPAKKDEPKADAPKVEPPK